MPPSEFYELSMDDYKHVQSGFKNRMQIFEGVSRRQAYVIAASNAGSNAKFESWFESVWPYGDKKIHDNIAEMIKQKRERGKKLAAEHNNNLQFQEAIKQLKANGRHTNTNRR